MADLIKKYLPKASGRDGGDLIAKADDRETVEVAVARSRRKPKAGRSRAQEGRARSRLPTRSRPSKSRRPGLCRTGAEAQGARRRRSDQHVVDRSRAFRLGDPGRLDAGPAGRPSRCSPRPASRRSSILADAAAYTVPFDKDGITYYRVRFGGFSSKSAAWNACSAAQEEEDRLLRRAPMSAGAQFRQFLPEMFCVEGVQW